MAKRDPNEVLGVGPGASLATVKAAWRKLARQHHPDLTGDDPAASRVATRRMAEINDAYETLRRAEITRGAGGADRGTPGAPDAGRGEAGDAGATGSTGRRSGGPPRDRPTRPVTGRVDTSDTFRPRNATVARNASSLRGHAPTRSPGQHREPPRASQPTGPMERGRIHRFRATPPPSLDAAKGMELEFGKFRGHTMGEVAAFEPSYVDWLASTITRDPDLVAAARVVQDDLDRRGVIRRERVAHAPAGRSA